MNDPLYVLMEAGKLPALSYYFARFVARGNAVDLDSVMSHSAALVSMRNLQGDVCVDLSQYADQPLFENSSDEEGDEPPAIPHGPALEDWLPLLQRSEWVGCPPADTQDRLDTPSENTPLILDGERLYLRKYWEFEQRVANGLLQRMDVVEGLDLARLTQGLARLFPQPEGNVVDWQRVAAAVAVSRRFSVISGGPGTGKTTTVVKVLALLLEQNPTLRIALAAPTGKAAARLTEAVRGGKGRVDADARVLCAIPEEASTIHRLLGFRLDQSFRHNRDNPLLIDCLVVDEASMIDLPLMARLLDALPDRTRIILLGDRDQLASVEAGSVLGDITGHGQEIRYTPQQCRFLEEIGAVRKDQLPAEQHPPQAADAVGLLRVSYRFQAESGIDGLSKMVNSGRGDAALKLFSRGRFRDIAWLNARSDGLHPACVDWAVERYAKYLGKEDVGTALRIFEQTRVLAALHQGPFGVNEINRLIAARLESRGLIQGGDEYHGKPVMITTNDYEVGLFNGDIGLLWRDGSQSLRAYFLLSEQEVRSVFVRQLPEHACGYALTVHKSQGSEFDEVLLVLPFDRSPVATRELIYTGITRARHKVSIHANPGSFVESCKTRVRRSSALAEKLGWAATRCQTTLTDNDEISERDPLTTPL